MSSTAVIAPPSNRPDQAWPQSTLPSQLALGQGNAQLAGQSIAELTQICREQAEELEGTAFHEQPCMLVAPQLQHRLLSCSQRGHYHLSEKKAVKFGSSSTDTAVSHS